MLMKRILEPYQNTIMTIHRINNRLLKASFAELLVSPHLYLEWILKKAYLHRMFFKIEKLVLN